MDKSRNNDIEKISLTEIKPNLIPSDQKAHNLDPVKEQRKKDVVKKTPEVVPEKASIVSTPIEPTLSTRIGLQEEKTAPMQGNGRAKYIIPRTRKQQRILEQNRTNTAAKFTRKISTKLPEPMLSKKLEIDLTVPSPEPSHAKVVPRKASPTSSMLYPDPQEKDVLELKKPKSGIFINETEQKPDNADYDSFDLVFSRTPRPDKKEKVNKAKKMKKDEDYTEGADIRSTTIRKSKKGSKKINDVGSDVITGEEGEEIELEDGEDGITNMMKNLTKYIRRRVSQVSVTTSYQSQDVKIIQSEQEVLEEPAIDTYMQKFRRESEIKQYRPKKRKFKRGTLESHSFTDINQPTLKDFFFGSKEGSMHQEDMSFPEAVRNYQGICMSVAAYCFSILKHPNKWKTEHVDEILEYGNILYSESLRKLHIHKMGQEVMPHMLQKYCTIREKKIRFTVEDPEVSGYILSDDKIVYNLTKALKIFFARQSSGILHTQNIHLAIWKAKYYYMFDARARTRDLYCSPEGTAIMANFYDISSLVTVCLERSNWGNWPFVIYPIKAVRILKYDEPEVDSNIDIAERSNYNILNANKAVVLGSFDLADKCFDFTRNKQSLPMSVVCLIYSRITPPSAWHRTTLDKIMVIGNELYKECVECESIDKLKLDNLPAIFTIGPYMIEIYIYANVFADLIYKSCCCQLQCTLEAFFDQSTNGILQLDNCHLAVWRQRNMFYCFDPYSRNNEGFTCRDGCACVSMHTNLDSLVGTIIHNFDKNTIFYLHAMKVCKIHRDPAQSFRFPKHLTMDNFPVDDFKKYKLRKSKKAATERPVTVDYSALAMRGLLAGETPDMSIMEIGSRVESVLTNQIPAMVQKHPSKSILKENPKEVDIIADLESPSLSDTQVLPPALEQPKGRDEIKFMDLDSFELTMEEIELQEIEPEYEDGGLGESPEGKYEDHGELDHYESMEGEHVDDWYYAMNQMAQVGEFSLPREISKTSAQINTDITYFPIKKEILYPTYLRGKQQMKYRLQRYKVTNYTWNDYFPPEPEGTKSQELRKETNFVDLPDDTQIILGSKNVADVGNDVEFIAPFACIMAGVVSKKYSILSWTGEIIDYILKCGNELYAASKFRYDQVSKLEIPRVSLGNTDFTVLVEYVFDSYTRQNILELAIDKILFVRSDVGVLVTPVYACALFYKNHLYYLYDCFGNNEVGLSEGPENKGRACFSRFKDLNSLASRIMYNKKKRESNENIIYSRFVLSSVKVKMLHGSKEDIRKKGKKPKRKEKEMKMEGDPDENIEQKEYKEEEGEEEEAGVEEGAGDSTIKKRTPSNKVGYQYANGLYTIQGTTATKGRTQFSPKLKRDHFICICACILLLTTPVHKWDTRKVDKILDYGTYVYAHADDLEISEKRTIKNILIQKHFFDIIVKQIKIENWRNNKNLSTGINTLLTKKLSYFMIQFTNACYVVHKSPDNSFHIFDPYGVAKTPNAGWIRCRNLHAMKKRLYRMIVSGGESYSFYNFEVTSIKKAPKDVLINVKLQEYELEGDEKKEHFGKPFYEEVEWLRTDPIPWTRRVIKSASGIERGKMENKWNNWDVEYPKDLFSLIGNIHQCSPRFSSITRGRQTLANLVVAIGMMEIYELSEWNAAIVDSVLVNGDNYLYECTKDIKEEDYEISVDDLKEECSIFPFTFKVMFTPIVEGTMFLVRAAQFNLYKALRYFFNKEVRRCGIICCNKPERKMHVAFGKLRESEYFMFDCDCLGPPMFLDGYGVAYILRSTTLNRLLHVLTLTLRGGDFYIYEVDIVEMKPLS